MSPNRQQTGVRTPGVRELRGRRCGHWAAPGLPSPAPKPGLGWAGLQAAREPAPFQAAPLVEFLCPFSDSDSGLVADSQPVFSLPFGAFPTLPPKCARHVTFLFTGPAWRTGPHAGVCSRVPMHLVLGTSSAASRTRSVPRSVPRGPPCSDHPSAWSVPCCVSSRASGVILQVCVCADLCPAFQAPVGGVSAGRTFKSAPLRRLPPGPRAVRCPKGAASGATDQGTWRTADRAPAVTVGSPDG